MAGKKPEQLDALEGAEPGVGVVRDRKLNALADDFTEKREKARVAPAQKPPGLSRRATSICS